MCLLVSYLQVCPGVPLTQYTVRTVCFVQVAKNMAQQWAIFKVGAAELVPGQSDAWAYVLKGRASADEVPSEFEQLAMQRSCSLVLEVNIVSRADLRITAWLLQGCMITACADIYGAE